MDRASRKPLHTLDRVVFTLRLPGTRYPNTTGLHVTGESFTKRGALWHYNESWIDDDDTMHELHPALVIYHMAMVVTQDRPETEAALDFGLKGGVKHEDPTLF